MTVKIFSKIVLSRALEEDGSHLMKRSTNCEDSCKPPTRINCAVTIEEVMNNCGACTKFNPADDYKQVSPESLSTGMASEVIYSRASKITGRSGKGF